MENSETPREHSFGMYWVFFKFSLDMMLKSQFIYLKENRYVYLDENKWRWKRDNFGNTSQSFLDTVLRDWESLAR